MESFAVGGFGRFGGLFVVGVVCEGGGVRAVGDDGEVALFIVNGTGERLHVVVGGPFGGVEEVCGMLSVLRLDVGKVW